jgi:hypothetical protein
MSAVAVEKSQRRLRLAGAVGEMRLEQFNGRDHLVVPVVGMVEGVVWAVNSEYPELVRAIELAQAPQQWNGRPCFAGHPEDNGTQITANTPETLEKSFGFVFNTISPAEILETKRLRFEAWLDIEKARELGGDAWRVIERLQAGEVVEVSIGCYVVAKQGEGEYNGLFFVGEWTEIVSDHLALLPEGEEGACSVAAGCGTPRIAVRHLVTAKGITREEKQPMSVPASNTKAPTLLQRLRSALQLRDSEQGGLGNRELRWKLYDKLRAVEPAFDDIDDVYPDENVVIYYVSPEGDWHMRRRTYSVADDGEITLAGESERVEPVMEYKVVGAAASTPRTNCGCRTATGENNVKEAVKTLIANSNGRFTDADAAWLDNVPETHLATLAASPETPNTPPASTPAPQTPSNPAPTTPAPQTPSNPAPASTPPAPTTASAAAPITLEQLPPEYREIISEHQALKTAQKNQLIATLKTAAAGVYSDEELNAMNVPQLEKLVALAGVAPVDFSGRSVPRSNASGETPDVFANPPASWDEALKTRNGASAN